MESSLGASLVFLLLGAAVGAAGAGWGASWALREKVMRLERDHGSRLQAHEARIGVDRDNRPTGNGLLGEVKRAHERIDWGLEREARDVRRIDRRNRRQHPNHDDDGDDDT